MRLTLCFTFLLFPNTSTLTNGMIAQRLFFSVVSPVGTGTCTALYITKVLPKKMAKNIKSGSFVLSFVNHAHWTVYIIHSMFNKLWGEVNVTIVRSFFLSFLSFFSVLQTLPSWPYACKSCFTPSKGQEKYKNRSKRKEPTTKIKYKFLGLGLLSGHGYPSIISRIPERFPRKK